MSTSLIDRTILDQYRVDRFLAAGGMGTVYQVWDKKRNVSLVMKLLHSDLAEDQAVFKYFQREARALEKLSHPNIVQFFGIYKTSEFAFLLERYVEGPSLKELLKQRKGTFTIQESLRYMQALSAALGYAHAHGVVHCDVKPGNVLVDQGGHIYLTDFGIARHTGSDVTTLVGIGSAAYMAPEQIRGEVVTPATDVYALGVVFFELLTGRRPFRGNEPGTRSEGLTANERIKYAHLSINPPDPRTINARIPEALSIVILKALSKEPSDRYEDTRQLFLAACHAVGTSPEAVSDNAEPPPKSLAPIKDDDITGVGKLEEPKYKKKAVIVSAGAMFVVLMLILIFFVIPNNNNHEPTNIVEQSDPGITEILITNTAPVQATETPSDQDNGSTSDSTPTITATYTPQPSPTNIPTEEFIPSLSKAYEWVSETVDAPSDGGYFSSLFIDQDGVHYIAYFDESSDQIKYTNNKNGWWEFNQITGGAGGGLDISLDHDSKNIPHIIYHTQDTKQTSPELHYIFQASTGQKDIRNFGKDVMDKDVSLDLDANDIPHMVFQEEGSYTLWYTKYSSSGGWENQQIGKAHPDNKELPIAVDDQNNPHVSYQDPEGRMIYAVLNDGTWEKSVIDNDVGPGAYSAIAVDLDGAPHVAYYDSNSGSLKYAALSGDTWIIYRLDEDGDIGLFPSIAVSKSGEVHISYYDKSNGNLKYVHFRDGSSNVYLVDDHGDVGRYNSIALTPAGIPSISYLDQTNEDLKLARAIALFASTP